MNKEINPEWLETYGWYVDEASGKWRHYELGIAESIDEAAEMTQVVLSRLQKTISIGRNPNPHVKS